MSRVTRWTVRELVIVGVVATIMKAATIMVTYMGGGMNPLALAVKNCLYVTLMIVLLHKVPKTWTMTLAVGITTLVSLLLMGHGVLLGPAALAASVIGEGIISALGGYGRTRNIIAGILTAELLSKVLGLTMTWLTMREQPAMLIAAGAFISMGVIGTFLGAFVGVRFMRELRHAGIISA
jgi:energy-coupling factor transport system substrate-specific component